MSAPKHTPAPWEVSHGGHGSPSGFVIDEYYVLSRSAADDVAIAAEIVDPATGMPSEANARLIAAAPDLFAIVATFDGYMELAGEEPEQDSNNPIRALRWKAQQALAKATGGAA
ncbi:MAG TPA: hypothetical protein VES70_27695 [Pseudomonas sp.]|nr:hypothetical protein [Pseudomonas sp.]